MKTRKFTALLLVLCLLLTAVPYSAPVHAVEEHLAQEQSQEQTQVETQGQVETQTAVEETTPAPLADGIFFKFVDQTVFQANGHVARVPVEETLSTYVFRNSDGTKTVYYLPDNVKYIASDGTMVDKDLTLVSKTGGYGVTRSDIGYLLPTRASSGIRMEHGGKEVVLFPLNQNSKAGNAAVSGDSVRYDNYFGSGIHLVYTPIPSGLKEDIVLDSYTGTNSFTFTLQTNGMRLYNNEGQYYLATSADAEEKIFLGDIVVYDAKGEPSAGTLTVATVTMGQQYTLTVSADPAFLTDPDTVYPVTIDPTLTVSAADNSSFIEDATIYQNKPATNAGNWTYNHCGYYASANTDYGRCRTAVRLAGLKNDPVWQSIAYSSVVSAKFYIKEASGTAAVRITLHEMTNTTWTEANATWNTLANAYSTTVSGYASPASGQWAEFNFTGLAREWREVNATSDCSFMLVNTNYTLDKAFYSAEYGTTSYRPYVVITYNEDTIETDGLNYTSHVMDEGSTLRLSWPDVTSEVTWTSSNDSIARVDETGFVRGIRTGRATITASADGYAPQTCTVTVTIRDGIYYLRNNRSNYFLGVPNSGVSSGTTLRQEVKSTTEPTCFAQMWRITHLSGLNYVIRPVHKPNMALSASSTLLTVQNTDGMASIPESCKWQITYDQNGYVFTRGYYDMLPTGHSTALNATVAMGTSNVSGSHLWSFILTDSFDDQVLLYDKRTSSYSNNIVRYVAPGETLTLSQLGIDAAFISEDTIEQNITWTSSNTSIATINATTGNIAPQEYGNTTITATATMGNNVTYKSYLLRVCLPVSGSEIPYNPNTWNNNASIRGNTNCYSYAFNNQQFVMQPGYASDNELSQAELTRDNVLSSIYADMAALDVTFVPVDQNDVCPSGTYKVALVLDPGSDYHWYRQNPDGTWSHKRGTTDVINYDASGNIIYNPFTADRDYTDNGGSVNYEEFLGFFYVTPLNYLYNPNRLSVENTINAAAQSHITFVTEPILLPSVTKAEMIKTGMTYSDVVSLIGHPQRQITFGLTIVEYDLENGQKLTVQYIEKDAILIVCSHSITGGNTQ